MLVFILVPAFPLVYEVTEETVEVEAKAAVEVTEAALETTVALEPAQA